MISAHRTGGSTQPAINSLPQTIWSLMPLSPWVLPHTCYLWEEQGGCGNSSSFPTSAEWGSAQVCLLVLITSKHLRMSETGEGERVLKDFWVFPLDVRSKIILWCSTIYLWRINRDSAFLNQRRNRQHHATSLLSLSRDFLLQGSSTFWFSSWARQQKLCQLHPNSFLSWFTDFSGPFSPLLCTVPFLHWRRLPQTTGAWTW